MMTSQHHYISTSIPYVNSVPHVGFALELVLADALARHARSQGGHVLFQGGTDDNSLKNVRAAEVAGISVTELVATNAARFTKLADALNISFNEYVSTGTDQRHRKAVEKLWRACDASGDLYKKAYQGLYCVGCEQYYTQDELVGDCCPDHGTPLETVREDNWFFRLSRYAGDLLGLIETGTLEIVPTTRRNEVLSLIRSGLEDICVSRSADRAKGWGIPVPDDVGEVIYVWFDALANYITGAGYEVDELSFERNWTQAHSRQHVIGKGITRFHAVYWPAILLSAGIVHPSRILVHGYLTVDGKKIGKSNGNGIDPFAVIDRYGTDALRWYLLRHVRTTEDADFSEDRLIAAHNADLADQLGNLVNRTLSVARKRGGPVSDHPGDATSFSSETAALRSDVSTAIEKFAINDAADAISEFVASANRYIGQAAPWSFLNRAHEEEASRHIDRTLAELFDGFTAIADCLAPFLPDASTRLHHVVGKAREGVFNSGILFPRLEKVV